MFMGLKGSDLFAVFIKWYVNWRTGEGVIKEILESNYRPDMHKACF